MKLTHGKNLPSREAPGGESAGILRPYPRIPFAPLGYKPFVTEASVKTTAKTCWLHKGINMHATYLRHYIRISWLKSQIANCMSPPQNDLWYFHQRWSERLQIHCPAHNSLNSLADNYTRRYLRKVNGRVQVTLTM